ncbi:hypothetical protein Ancab_025501 [Ancistrocladus abbreviatus]
MALSCSRIALCRVSLARYSSLSSLNSSASAPNSLPLHPRPVRGFDLPASLSTKTSTSVEPLPLTLKKMNHWKPMCLYYTQGKCAKMDDPVHLDKFSHSCSEELQTYITEFRHKCSQNLDFFMILDLEGKIEILEFPVLMIDSNTMQVVDFFHRFVRPSKMSKQRIDEYIEGKYGKFGVDRVWHDTAIPFKEVIQEFEAWIIQHNLWEKDLGGPLNRAAFVTCGNWDIKTKVPQQCKVSGMKLPTYFMEWINLKDVYLNFYKRRATGMVTMLRELNIPLLGSHHLGIDDTKNIAKVLQRMLADGALMQISARRNSDNPENVEFLFKDRIR